MRNGVIWALISTGIAVASSAIATGAFSFFMWALALNGFMGQERAVNASMASLIVFVTLSSLACVALSIFSTYYLSVKRHWHAAGAAFLSIVVFLIVVIGLQLLSLFISVIVADQMRTVRQG